MPTSVDVEGEEDVLAHLDTYKNAKWLSPLLNDLVNYALGKLPKYPPTRPNQRYRRTGTLGRSITGQVKFLGTEYVGAIGTNIGYAKWVIDEDNQAWMHKGRWWTLQKSLRDMTGQLINFAQSRLSNYLK